MVDGRPFVILHDQRDGRSVKIGEREWALVACMDGTRDVEGLVTAAARRGARMTLETAGAFVAELTAAGLLEMPLAATVPPADEEGDVGAGPDLDAVPLGAAVATPADRPLEPLADYLLACDGAGTCCRLYPTIAFLPLDVARARAALPLVLDGGDDADAVFTPARGTIDPIRTVASVEGRCAYLQPGGRCGIHAAAGSANKPFGCRTYPTTFVDDGVSVRVTPRPECLCVPRSAVAASGAEGPTEPAGEPLLAPGVLTRGDLPTGIFVHRLPITIRLGGGLDAPREALSAWSRAVAGASTPDAAAAFAALARAVAERGLDAESQRALAVAPPPLDADVVLPRLERLRTAVARRASETWRSPDDLAHRGFLSLEAACDLALAAPETFTRGPRSERERGVEAFHFRATLFGHLGLATDTPPSLAEALEARATLVIAARALAVVAELTDLEDPAFAWPLSLTEALARGFGLSVAG